MLCFVFEREKVVQVLIKHFEENRRCVGKHLALAATFVRCSVTFWEKCIEINVKRGEMSFGTASYEIVFLFFVFNCHLAVQRTTLGLFRGDRLTDPMLITAFSRISIRRSSRPLRWGGDPSGVWTGNLPILIVTP